MRSTIWRASFQFWVVATLSFMALMGIASGFFVLMSLPALYSMRAEFVRLAKNSGYTYASLFLFGACFLSALAAMLSPPFGGVAPAMFANLQKFHYFLLPPMAAMALLYTCSAQQFESHPAWRYFYWMAVFVSLVGIAQFWGSYLFPESWLSGKFFRVVATGGSVNVYHSQGLMKFHLSFASAMGFVVSYALARVVWPRKFDGARVRLAWAALTVVSAMALFFTYSRISWIALLALVATIFFLKRIKWGLVAVSGAFVVAAGVWTFSENLRARWMAGIWSITERQNLWLAAWEMFRDRPLTGVGFGKTGFYSEHYTVRALGYKPHFTSHAHNNFLEMLAATGAIGFIAYLAWWILLAVYAWRNFRVANEEERWLPGACLAGLVAFQVNGLTQVNFWDAKSQHSLMLWAGIVVALEWRRRLRERAS